MNKRGILRSTAAVFAVAVGCALVGAVPANAATEDDVAAWITESTLAQLNVNTPDAELSAALSNAISQALEAGLISAETVDVAEEAVDDPDSIESDDIEEAIDEAVTEQGEAWDEVKTAWHTAFDEITAEFADCREAAEGGADLCAHQFRYEMQVNHVTAWLARHAVKAGDISLLPVEEQAAAAARFEHKGELAAARLDRARTQLEKKTGEPVDEEFTEEELTTIESVSPDSDQAKPGKGNSADKPGKGASVDKGNKGNGNSNGKGKNAR